MKKLSIPIIFRIILIVVVLISLYSISNNKHAISSKSDEYVKTNEQVVNENKLDEAIVEEVYQEAQNINEDIVGNIKITGTNIDQKLLQGDDNDYYLNHNKEKQEDINGSIFIDYRNNLDDKKILIYGHNGRVLKTVPFHDLEKFISPEFLKVNNNIEIILNGKVTNYKIFSVIIVSDGNNTHMKLKFDNDSWLEHLAWLKDNSLYDTLVEVSFDDKIIVLQTCYFNPDNSYLIISAKEI